VRWDIESVNTCPDNYQWKVEEGSGIFIEAPGLYELTFAFFAKKKSPMIQVLANDDVILQTFAVPSEE
jgi:hypothetical protein